MATNKNIIMKQFNGTDYDTLYPKTIAAQIDDVYSKSEVYSKTETYPKSQLYTKDQTLKNATKSLYGLSSSATPNDVFQKISDSTTEIGDIKITVRTDLGDKWLLCNGDSVSSSAYPDLANKIKTVSGQQITDGTDYYILGDIACYNGTWVATGQNQTDNSLYVFFTTDPTGVWTKKQVTSQEMKAGHIACYNGTWVIATYTQTGWYGRIFVSTNLSGTWTSKSVDNQSLNGIACFNGTWVITASSGSGGASGLYILTTTNPTGTWTEKQISDASYDSANGLICINGTWVILNTKYYIWTTTNPSGTWTKKQISENTSVNEYLRGITYYNGTWVILGVNDNSIFIRTATNPSGTWTQKIVTTKSKTAYDIVCCNGLWVITSSYDDSEGVTNPCIYTTFDLNTSWLYREFIDQRVSIGTIVSYGDIWVAVGHKLQSSGTSTAYPYIYTNSYLTLPIISLDGTYAYIKALE